LDLTKTNVELTVLGAGFRCGERLKRKYITAGKNSSLGSSLCAGRAQRSIGEHEFRVVAKDVLGHAGIQFEEEMR
jgi:hypothetical protein